MRMILRLSKEEPVRFVSHLELQGMLQRALRRCRLPVAYTMGFHPHAQLSFALALGVGFTSAGEYVDVRLNGEMPQEECGERLAAVLPEGFGVCAVRVLEGGPGFSELMHASDYRIKAAENSQKLIEGMRNLMEEETIMVRKQGKRGTQDTDIRPMIFGAGQDGEGICVRLWASAEGTLSPALMMPALWESVRLPAGTPYRARRIDLVTGGGQSLLESVASR